MYLNKSKTHKQNISLVPAGSQHELKAVKSTVLMLEMATELGLKIFVYIYSKEDNGLYLYFSLYFSLYFLNLSCVAKEDNGAPAKNAEQGSHPVLVSFKPVKM